MGYFRFFLALLVASNHLWIIGGVGRYAVFSFYILSGYLMTTIILKRYGTSQDGIKRYAINRLLRIYPTYIISFIATIAAIKTIGGEYTHLVDPNLSIPQSIEGWIMNTTLIGLDFNVQYRTIPPSWTLFIELFFYSIIPIAVRLGKKIIFLWLVLSILYHAYFIVLSHSQGYDWNSRYGDLFAGSLGFSIGCSLRTFKLNFLKSNIAFQGSILGLVFCYSTPTYFMLHGYSEAQWDVMSTIGFYSTMAFTSIFIINSINKPQSKINRFLGDLSYPLYLIHIPIGFVVITSFNLTPKTFESFIISLAPAIIASILLHTIDNRINKIRDQFRPVSIHAPS